LINTVYQQKKVKQTLQNLNTIQISKETLKERNEKQMQELQKSRKEAIQEIRKTLQSPGTNPC
jgi:FtsZ-binding cell division protein ZapB